jgi:hypothetical protein
MVWATVAQVEALLGRPLTAAEIAALDAQEEMFVAQIEEITGVFGQVVDDTITVAPLSCVSGITIPGPGPVETVTSVEINGTPVGSPVWTPDGTIRLGCCVCPGDVVTVVATHGEPMPAYLVAFLARLLTAQVLGLAEAAAATGVKSETIGSYSYDEHDPDTVDRDPRALGALSDADIAWLKSKFRRGAGTLSLRGA